MRHTNTNNNAENQIDYELEEIIKGDSFPRRVVREIGREIREVGRRLKTPVLFIGISATFGAGAYIGWDLMQNYMNETAIYSTKSFEEAKVDRHGRIILRQYNEQIRMINPNSHKDMQETDKQSNGNVEKFNIGDKNTEPRDQYIPTSSNYHQDGTNSEILF